MKKVFIQGAFDILTAGHCRLLKYAKEKGDYLVVGLNSDSLIHWYEKRQPAIPFSERSEILSAVKYVDEVIKCDSPQAVGYLSDIDIYVMVGTWHDNQKEAIAYMESKGCATIIPITYANVLRSEEIRQRIKGAK